MSVDVKLVKHSKSGGTELITLEIQLHRFILPEFNTHRSLSRNFQSSRAVPIIKLIEQVRDNPAIPVHWGENQGGMVAEEEVSYYSKVDGRDYWEKAARSAADYAQLLASTGLHKQIVNRVLEPFMWTRGVVTGTLDAWQGFIKLRSHVDAQPEIKVLSDKIKDVVLNSKPDVLAVGQWHLPYINNVGDFSCIKDAIKVSTSCCAQVSYRMLDDSLEKANRIYDMLNLPESGVFKEQPAHMSPCEHVAMATNEYFSADELGLCYSESDFGGNFQSNDFFQYRKMLEFGDEVMCQGL